MPKKAKPSAKLAASKPPALADVLPRGVYFDSMRHIAVVYHVGRLNVHFVSMRSGSIEAEQMAGDAFTKVFIGRWPAYPLRRAAHLLLASELSKSLPALHQLRLLAAQA